MKVTGHCPKCGSSRVIVAKAKPYTQYSIGATNGWGVASAVIDRHFCIDCGYTEEYAQLTKKFKKWAEKEFAKQKPNTNDGFV